MNKQLKIIEKYLNSIDEEEKTFLSFKYSFGIEKYMSYTDLIEKIFSEIENDDKKLFFISKYTINDFENCSVHLEEDSKMNKLFEMKRNYLELKIIQIENKNLEFDILFKYTYIENSNIILVIQNLRFLDNFDDLMTKTKVKEYITFYLTICPRISLV